MDFPQSGLLRDLQDYIWEMNKERGFNTEDVSKKLVMLMEEMGELAKAARKQAGLKFSETTSTADLEEELADVQIVLLGLASMLGVDMLSAVEKKEQANRRRTWK